MRIPALLRSLPLAVLATSLLLLGSSEFAGADATHQGAATRVRVETSRGNFVIELDAVRAPLTVANFLEYVKAGHYTDTIFHRVVGNFVVQGGGYDIKNVEKPVQAGIPNESGNGLSNRRGTVGLARTGEPHSGNAQFYVNLMDNPLLDPQTSRWGYAVFGRIVEGMSVVDEIGAVATGSVGPFDRDAPLVPVLIRKIAIIQ